MEHSEPHERDDKYGLDTEEVRLVTKRQLLPSSQYVSEE
jgi:hypothetical protein